mmetsp:Transcript_41440/g.133720  ORF Transcript_41440/g.133720 Transcript_41440/m.133720 type:complete len:330 (-) Transcript_41440:195-1184(-)
MVDVRHGAAHRREGVQRAQLWRKRRRLERSEQALGSQGRLDGAFWREVRVCGGQHRGQVPLESEEDSVGAGVEGVPADGLSGSFVEGVHHSHDGSRGVIHVEDGRVRVEAGGVELVRVAHHQLRHLAEIARLVRGLHLGQPARHDGSGAVREQRRGVDGRLHARSRRDCLLGVRDDEDQHLQLRPVRLVRHLPGARVDAVGALTHVPRHKAARERAASGAGPHARDARELVGERVGQAVQLGEGEGEGCVPRRRRREPRRGRKVVFRHDPHAEAIPLVLADKHLSRLGVAQVAGARAHLAKHGEHAPARVDVLLFPVEPKAVAAEAAAR